MRASVDMDGRDVVVGAGRILAGLLEETREVLEAVENNRRTWVQINSELLSRDLPRNMDMFPCLDTFDYVIGDASVT